MLVVTRRAGESIMIGDDIEIYVAEISGRQVRLGITAPDRTTIVRKELHLRQKAMFDKEPT